MLLAEKQRHWAKSIRGRSCRGTIGATPSVDMRRYVANRYDGVGTYPIRTCLWFGGEELQLSQHTALAKQSAAPTSTRYIQNTHPPRSPKCFSPDFCCCRSQSHRPSHSTCLLYPPPKALRSSHLQSPSRISTTMQTSPSVP